ncbi:MAG: hypothetical protein A3A65_00575 [Candidatus Chisholmbacteria bacterium RIFCSPLOWO2_01_FULL_49_14]|uniref:LytR/CpsA/Psr regulator C-terminal domain-containing protein n=1 Tax=Candidatus Chisholmbacteria bacterium RIFCSPLOWO2_01_FULL_49_14 TaxID=1797593 RepID=A0A1G1VZ27_9BACT|nr:MAG: hypothetical protein A3A65_00575 [Candidatus Chisholmbacteria bacterium RIFCSPLOWO2_01_FULL_49_14]
MSRRTLPGSARADSVSVKRESRNQVSKSRKQTFYSSFFFTIKRWLLVLGMVMTLALIGMSLRAYGQRVWKGNDRITIALQTGQSSLKSSGVYVVSFLKSEKAVSVISFPVGIQVEASGGHGSWKVESLYPLGELNGKGGELLKHSLSEFLGVPIQGWIVDEKTDPGMNREGVIHNLQQILGKSMVAPRTTNLTLWDSFRLLSNLFLTHTSVGDWVDLSQSKILIQASLPDGSQSYSADPALVDHLSQQLFLQPQLIDEALSIAVVNATEHQGLGARAARLIANSGGEIVGVSDRNQISEETTIIVSSKQNLTSFSAGFLSSQFLADQVIQGETSGERADIVLVVGEGYYRYFAEP